MSKRMIWLTDAERNLLYSLVLKSEQSGEYYGDEAEYQRRLGRVRRTLERADARDEATYPVVMP